MNKLLITLGILSLMQLVIGGCIDSCNSECYTYRCRRTCYNECQRPCSSCCDGPSCSSDCDNSPCKEKQEYISPQPVYNVQPPSHSNVTLTLNNLITTVNKIENPINVTTVNVNNIQFMERNDTVCCNIAVPQNCGHANCDVEIVYTCSERCRELEEQVPVYRPPEPPVYLPPVYQPPPPPAYQPPVYQPPIYQPPVFQPPVYQPPQQPVYIPQPCAQFQEAPTPCPYG